MGFISYAFNGLCFLYLAILNERTFPNHLIHVECPWLLSCKLFSRVPAVMKHTGVTHSPQHGREKNNNLLDSTLKFTFLSFIVKKKGEVTLFSHLGLILSASSLTCIKIEETKQIWEQERGLTTRKNISIGCPVPTGQP